MLYRKDILKASTFLRVVHMSGSEMQLEFFESAWQFFSTVQNIMYPTSNPCYNDGWQAADIKSNKMAGHRKW